MHKRFRERLEALEEARKLTDAPAEMRHICFVGRDRREVESTIAEGPRGFICRRNPGEELDAFKARADAECRAAHPRGLAILFFLPGKKGEAPNAA
jgi:hypothetical protein